MSRKLVHPSWEAFAKLDISLRRPGSPGPNGIVLKRAAHLISIDLEDHDDDV
jgi:hypothetical protein